MFRFNLLARLVLLVAVATVPAALALVVLERDVGVERDQRARQAVLQQARFVNADVGSILEGARQLMLGLARLPAIRGLDPACARDLSGLDDELPQYAFLAVLDGAGRVVCASGTSVPQSLPRLRLGALPREGAPGVGAFTASADGVPAVLPIVQPLGAGGSGVMVAALSLDWLSAHLATLRRPTPGTIIVADRDGRQLAGSPPDPAQIGRLLAADMAPLVGAAAPATIERIENGRRVDIGYVPASVPPVGLLVMVAAAPANLIPGLARAAAQGYAVIAAGFLLATALALLAGHRYLRQPTAVLLGAAHAWERGDLAARARLHDPSGTEFSTLAAAFNGMAEALGRQQSELRALNDALETRVADRTRALLESNNRLQVVIAERERTEESLRQAQKLQAVGQLAGGIAHDFNNLLTAVAGSLDMLRRIVAPEDGRGQRLLAAAAAATARGGRLTGQLLAFSRKQKLVPASTDVNRVVTEMSPLFAGTLGPAIRVETRLDPDAWPAMTDPNQLEAAILNLAINARDAMAAGGRLVVTTANLALQEADAPPGVAAGDYVVLTVSDTGTGMSQQVLARAFEPFFTTKAIGQGSGLGLSQVHGLAEQSGGTVRIASRPGAGSSVSMLLPRALAPAATPAATGPLSAGAGPRIAILLVDDDAEVREVTAEILNEAGHTVHSAPGGAEALEILDGEGSAIGLVIADYAMPGMNGIELARAVRAERPGLPILMATGYAELEPDGQALLDDIIRKPYRPSDLLARVNRLLAAREPAGAG